MIFISYNHNDSELVSVIANKLSDIFTTEKIFFDKWSIQPGDGIIEKMNSGLNEAKFMFFSLVKIACPARWSVWNGKMPC